MAELPPESTLALYGSLLFTLSVCLGWLIGRLNDPCFKCSMLRRFTKKPWVVLKITQKDSTLISTHVVNSEKDVAIVNNDLWVITDGSIYLGNKSEIRRKEDVFKHIDGKKGVILKADNMKTEENVPTIYVDRDSMMPKTFYRNEGGDVKPTEIGSTLIAWVFNQYAKALAKVNEQRMLILGVLLITILVGALGYNTSNTVNDIQKKGVICTNVGTLGTGTGVVTGNNTVTVHAGGGG